MGSTLPFGPAVERTVPRLLAGAVEAVPDKPWLFHEGASFTYEQAWRRVATAAAQLAGRGVARGDLVLVPMRNTAGHLFTWLGLMHLGAVLVAANPAAAEAEQRGLVAQTQPRLVLGDADVAPQPAFIHRHIRADERQNGRRRRRGARGGGLAADGNRPVDA
jgi:acyl-CoA synthetase (AMP-forming)/AMP-acid ligase II